MPAVGWRVGATLVLSAAVLAGCGAAGRIAAGGEPATRPVPSSTSPTPSHHTRPAPTQSPAKFEPTKRDWTSIQRLLDRRGQALAAGRSAAFLATVDPANAKLLARQRTLFANIQSLPVTSMRYTMTDVGLPPSRVRGHDPVLSPPVVEHVLLAGTDARPVANEPHDTFVRRHGRWLLGAESDNGNSPSRPWGGPRIAVATRGPLVVVIDADDAADLTRLTDSIVTDLTSVAQAVHQPVDSHVLVDATTYGGATRLSDVGPQEAAAVTFPVAAEDAQGHQAGQAGWRIKINPKQIHELIDNQVVLRHELTHFVLRRYGGSDPTWLTEGVANYVGYLPVTMPAFTVTGDFYAKLVAPPHQLPNSGVFDIDPDVSYLVAQASVTYLVEHYGMDKLLTLMAGYTKTGQPLADSATARLLRQTYGIATGQLVAGTYGLLGQLGH